MSSEDGRVQDWLHDVIDYADQVASYVEGMSFDRFVEDKKTRDASERCLERIIEACIRLGPDRMTRIAPDLPLHQVRGLGNMLRHAYEAIDAKLIWDTITEDLPPLRTACQRALSTGAD